MKKSLLALAVGMLLSTSVASADTMYFANTDSWTNVYAKVGSAPWSQLSTEDGITLAEGYDENKMPNGDFYKYDVPEGIAYVQFSNLPDSDPGFLVTSKVKVIDGAVYDAKSEHIGDIANKVYTPAPSVAVVNTGYYLIGNFNSENLLSSYQFSSLDEVYSITTTLVAGSKFKIQCKDDSKKYGLSTAVDGATEDALTLTAGGDYITVNATFTATLSFTITDEGLSFEITDVTEPQMTWYGAWQNGTNWTLAATFTKGEDGAYTATMDAGTNSTFALFLAVGNQTWSEGTRYMPAGEGDAITIGSASTWALNSEFPVGSWNLKIVDTDFTYTREAEAIVIENKATEITDGSWTGSLEADATVRFFYNGDVYGFENPEVDAVPNGNDLVYTLALKNNGDAFSYSEAADAVISVAKFEDGATATITIKNANKPVMMVGEKAVDLTLSGGYYNAYDVAITAEDAISFVVNGVTYVPTMPETIAFEAKEVTMALTPGTTGASFANVQTKWYNGDETPFITKDFNPSVRVNSALTNVTFAWDARTGVDAIEDDNNGEAVYFNLQGVRVANPENGIFIEVKGGKAVKVRK